MKRMIYLFAVVCFLTTDILAWAVVTIVVDKKGVKVELTSLKTEKIYFNTDNFENLAIPVGAISTILLSKGGKSLILQSTKGIEVKGTSDSKLEGEWELGDYSVSLSDVKSVEFRWATQQQKITNLADLPEGYFALVTDWNGKTMEVFNFEYRGSYYYSSPYINRSSHMSYLNRSYIPVEYKEIIVGIPFSNIDVVKFTDVESTNSEWQPNLSIKLLDGSKLEVKMAPFGEYAPKFTGEVSQGDLIERIHQIEFNHNLDKNASSDNTHFDFYKELNSVYTISFQTLQGNKAVFRNGTLLGINDEGYRCIYFRTEFKIKFGESTTVVDFSKMKSIKFTGESKAQMTTTSGKVLDILLLDFNEIWIGGNFGKFGPARIELNRISSLEINKTGE